METLRLVERDAVVELRLNRPEVRNAFSAAMIRELHEAARMLAERKDIRVVVLRGEGKVFSAGADLNWMRASLDATAQENEQDALRLAEMLDALDQLPQFLLGRVQGAALGGGMGLVAVCDLVVAAENARFGFTEVRLGLIPATISPFVIRKMGVGQARRYFQTGELFGAHEAKNLGLVHEVVPEEALDATVDALIQRVLENAPQAVQEAKKLARWYTAGDRRRQMEETARWLARIRVQEEAREGIRAFLEKRSPRWKS